MKPKDTEENQGQPFNPYAEFELETFQALLKDRIVLFNDDVSKNIIERVVLPITSLSQKSRKPIKFLINSPGGSVENGQMVVDTLITSKAPIITIAMGEAMSAAFDIFIAGDRRIVYPNTILMMHSGSSRFDTLTLPQHNIEADLHRKYFERWSAWYASRTKVDQKEWLKMLNTGLNYYFFPEEALKLGLCHEIIQPVSKNVVGKRKFKF